MLSEELRKRTKYGDTFVQSFIKEDHQKRFLPYSKSMLRLFRKYCFDECNDADRLKCILRPCTEILEGNKRRLLDLYIESGINKEDLPLFCYSQRNQEISGIIEGKERYTRSGIVSPNPKIFLRDFLDILFPKSSKPLKRALQREKTFIDTLTKRLEEKENITVYPSYEDYILFSNGKNIFFIDLDREIVTVNPREHSISGMAELNAFTSFFSQKYDVPTHLMAYGFGWRLIQFQVYKPKQKFTTEEKNMLQQYLFKLRKDKERLFSTFQVSHEAIYINIDVYYHEFVKERYFTYNNEKLLVSSLEGIFSAIKRIQREITQKLEKMKEES